MSHSRLPERPNLDHLKNQAQKLLKDYQNNAHEAVRIIHRISHLKDAKKVKLAEAQLALALEYGFAGWSELRQYVLAQRALLSEEKPVSSKNILSDMRVQNGKVEDDGSDRVAVFHGGPSSTLVSTESFPGDAIVVEVRARPEVDSQWGMHFQCLLNPFGENPELWRSGICEPLWRISCGRREKDVWSSILYNAPGAWSRDINYYKGFSSFNAIANKWYTLKAERLGQMLRLWVDGVPIFETLDTRPVPEKLYVWVASVCSNVRFGDVTVSRPSNSYISRYSRPIKLFDPYAQKRDVLARYPGRIVKEVSVMLEDKVTQHGLRYISSEMDGTVESKGGLSGRRAIGNDDNLPFMFFSLENATGWNWSNVINLDVEYLDDRKGDLGVFYRTWHFRETPTPDIPMNGDGNWKTVSLKNLRDPFFVQDQQDGKDRDISITALHPVQPGPVVRTVRVTEEEKPREAYEEIIRIFDQEIEIREDQWTVWHYEYHKALIYRYNLNNSEEADRIMKRVSIMAPECECIPIYAATKAKLG